jgi:hypothetical protein
MFFAGFGVGVSIYFAFESAWWIAAPLAVAVVSHFGLAAHYRRNVSRSIQDLRATCDHMARSLDAAVEIIKGLSTPGLQTHRLAAFSFLQSYRPIWPRKENHDQAN